MVDDATIFRAMSQAAEESGRLICMHAENGGAVDVIVQRALAEGKRENLRIYTTRSRGPRPPKAKPPVAPLRWRRWQARRFISCIFPATMRWKRCGERAIVACRRMRETCPQYLYLSLEQMDAPGFEGAKYVLARRCARNGIRKSCVERAGARHVGGFHGPLPILLQESKLDGELTKIPNGGPGGIEHRLSLVYTGGVHGGRFSPNRFVQLVATAPAKLFGLFPRKGPIRDRLGRSRFSNFRPE